MPGRQDMASSIRSAKTKAASWDVFADVDVFVETVVAEIEAMPGAGRRRPPKPPLTGEALRKAVMAIWCVAFCGMQWRAVGRLCGMPFATLYALFARWTRLGLWRRLLDRLITDWRHACGDDAPSAVVIDSRSCRSAPTCYARGIDGGKRVRGVKLHLAVDKHGLPLAIDVSPGNIHDSKGILPVLRILAGRGFRGHALGDLSYRGKKLAAAAAKLKIAVEAVAGGCGGTFIPEGIRWVVERSFAWISRYRRLNTIFERTKEHLIAFVEIAFISILARRLARLEAKADAA
jgi:transposase